MAAQRDPITGRFVRATPPDVLRAIEQRPVVVPARRRRVATAWIVAVFVLLAAATAALIWL